MSKWYAEEKDVNFELWSEILEKLCWFTRGQCYSGTIMAAQGKGIDAEGRGVDGAKGRV